MGADCCGLILKKGRGRDDHVEVFLSIESKILYNLSIVAEIDLKKMGASSARILHKRF